MLGLARAIMAPPRLLLIYEMSLSLMPKAIDEMLNAISEFAASGVAVLLTE
jgi:branched-chain amino acid transport system ATP-binding protein